MSFIFAIKFYIKKYFIPLFFLSWISLVGVNYFTNFPILSLGIKLKEIFFIFLIVLTGFALGSKVFKFLNVSFMGFLEEFVFSLGLGWGILSYLVFALGICGLLYRSLFYFIFLALIVLLNGEIKYFSLSVMNAVGQLQKKSFSAWNLILMGTLGIGLLMSLAAAFAPPTFYDSLVYHLACPGSYIQQHKIIYFPYNLLSNFPQNMEMMYTMALLLCDDIVANLIHFSFAIMLILGIYSFCKRYFQNRQMSFLSILVFFSTPAIMLLAGGTYIDLGLTFFVFMSVYALINWSQHNKYFWFIISAVFNGLALTTKYTGIINLFILTVFVLWKLVMKDKNRNFGNILRHFVVYLFLPCLILFPWLIKNFAYTGNPFFPFLCGLFKGNNINVELAENYINHIRTYGMTIHSFFDLLILPWTITMQGIKFGGGFDVWGAVWGPLFLFFLPFLFFLKKNVRIIKQLKLYVFLYFCIWILTGKVLRFLLVILPFLSILIAHCLISLENKGKGWKLIRLVLVISVVGNFFLFGYLETVVDPFPVALGMKTREEYLKNKLDYYKGVKFINSNLPEEVKVLFIGETRGYYCERQYIAATVFDLNPIVEIANNSDNEEEMLEKLQQLGITHIFYNAQEAKRLAKGYHVFYWTDRGYQVNKNFKQKCLRCIYNEKFIYVYEIDYSTLKSKEI